MPNTPAIRYTHDADELNRLAQWLTDTSAVAWDERKRNTRADAEAIALDYFRLADRLAQLSEDAREFARIYGGPLP